jgi:hypothetical protein
MLTKEEAKKDRADEKAKMVAGGNHPGLAPDDDQLNDDAFLNKAEEEFKRKPVIPQSIFGDIKTMPRNPSVGRILVATKT